MKLRKISKKAELTDYLIYMITLVIFAIGFLILMFVIPNISNGLRSAGMNSSSEGSYAIDQMDVLGTSVINNGFMMLFIGLTISMMITSFLVRTHPIFLFLYILFLGLTLLIGLYLGNAYYTLESNPIMANILPHAGFIHLVMNNLVLITLAVSALSMIIVFSKFSTGGNPQY